LGRRSAAWLVNLCWLTVGRWAGCLCWLLCLVGWLGRFVHCLGLLGFPGSLVGRFVGPHPAPPRLGLGGWSNPRVPLRVPTLLARDSACCGAVALLLVSSSVVGQEAPSAAGCFRVEASQGLASHWMTTHIHSPTTTHRATSTNHQPPTTNHQPPTTNHHSPITNHTHTHPHTQIQTIVPQATRRTPRINATTPPYAPNTHLHPHPHTPIQHLTTN